ncbi:MAG: hypothetical protein AAFQ58_17650 [Pseudomonadota bacterium]
MLIDGLSEQVELIGKIAIELNTTREGSCTLTFLVSSEQAEVLDKLVFETALFDTDGPVIV